MVLYVPRWSGRSFRVLYCKLTSYAVYIVCSVPHGSVLGPCLFIFYMVDLADEVQEHQVNMHTYADDTQLYLHCRHYDNAAAVTRLETCLNGVSHWMAANRLRLNAEKTDYCGLGRGSVPKLSLADWLQRPSVQCSTETVSASDDVRVIGVTFSSDLSLDKHVTSVCSSGFHWLRQLRRVRRSLDMDSTKTLVHAFIASHVD